MNSSNIATDAHSDLESRRAYCLSITKPIESLILVWKANTLHRLHPNSLDSPQGFKTTHNICMLISRPMYTNPALKLATLIEYEIYVFLPLYLSIHIECFMQILPSSIYQGLTVG